MEYVSAHHLEPHELTDAIAILHYAGDRGWEVAGFVVGAAGASLADQRKFAVEQDATIRNEPIIAKRIQADDVRLARYKAPEPPPPPPPEISFDPVEAPAAAPAEAAQPTTEEEIAP